MAVRVDDGVEASPAGERKASAAVTTSGALLPAAAAAAAAAAPAVGVADEPEGGLSSLPVSSSSSTSQFAFQTGFVLSDPAKLMRLINRATQMRGGTVGQQHSPTSAAAAATIGGPGSSGNTNSSPAAAATDTGAACGTQPSSSMWHPGGAMDLHFCAKADAAMAGATAVHAAVRTAAVKGPGGEPLSLGLLPDTKPPPPSPAAAAAAGSQPSSSFFNLSSFMGGMGEVAMGSSGKKAASSTGASVMRPAISGGSVSAGFPSSVAGGSGSAGNGGSSGGPGQGAPEGLMGYASRAMMGLTEAASKVQAQASAGGRPPRPLNTSGAAGGKMRPLMSPSDQDNAFSSLSMVSRGSYSA